jgi:putative DNA primase/helicase
LWPETINGASVLDKVAERFCRYLRLPDGAADVLALWCAHSHAFKAFLCSPRLNISSPERGCGKTTLRDVVALFVPRPVLTENMSIAVLFRVVAAHAPTILADEYDAWLKDNEELRGLFNAGHRRGATVLRCEGDNNEVRAFAAYAPAVLCGIGALPGTLHDRSIVIRLQRAKPGEVCARFDPRHTKHEQELCQKLARWCADNSTQLEAADPVLPDRVFNRLADNWRPLFAIAEIAGGDWPQRVATAFAKLNSHDDEEAQSIIIMLLADIRQVFANRHVERLSSSELADALVNMEGRPWVEFGRNEKPLTATKMSRMLTRFGISSSTKRVGEETFTGFDLDQFTDAFDRYLACENVTESQHE